MKRLFWNLLEWTLSNGSQAAILALAIVSTYSSCAMESRIEELENMIEDTRYEARSAERSAEEAMSKAREAAEEADDAKSAINDLEIEFRYRN